MSTTQRNLFAPQRWPLQVRLIARLLWLANCEPWWAIKHRFYAMKQRIVERWGVRDGLDYQEIVKPCWSCEGTGGLWEPGGCYKCQGDGIYARFWVALERWQLAGYVFHRPLGRVDRRPEHVEFHGYIRHGKKTNRNDAAMMWLVRCEWVGPCRHCIEERWEEPPF